MPRAAVLSLHARVAGTAADAWDVPPLVQLWGPRYSAYLVVERDAAVFTLGRLPASGPTRRVAEDLADRMARALGDAPVVHSAAARALGEPPNRLRYATLTGRIRIRWDGARQPTIRVVPPPAMDEAEARRELARRALHVFGPLTPDGFAAWAGVKPKAAQATFDELLASLIPVGTPIGDAWILASDEALFRAASRPAAPARLLPSGDTYFLFHRPEERAMLVERASERDKLWTSRVWPGALLVNGEIAGTWRRSETVVTVESWRRLSRAERQAVEEEAAALPLPGNGRDVAVSWL